MSDVIKLSGVGVDCPDAGELAAFYAEITGGTSYGDSASAGRTSRPRVQGGEASGAWRSSTPPVLHGIPEAIHADRGTSMTSKPPLPMGVTCDARAWPQRARCTSSRPTWLVAARCCPSSASISVATFTASVTRPAMS